MNDTWLEIYQTTPPAPLTATQAFILINSLPQTGTAGILVDDVALLTAPIGATDATGSSTPTSINRIYAVNGSTNVFVINGNTNSVIATIPVGNSPRGQK